VYQVFIFHSKHCSDFDRGALNCGDQQQPRIYIRLLIFLGFPPRELQGKATVLRFQTASSWCHSSGGIASFVFTHGYRYSNMVGGFREFIPETARVATYVGSKHHRESEAWY
jgi:hypothetical protein